MKLAEFTITWLSGTEAPFSAGSLREKKICQRTRKANQPTPEMQEAKLLIRMRILSPLGTYHNSRRLQNT